MNKALIGGAIGVILILGGVFSISSSCKAQVNMKDRLDSQKKYLVDSLAYSGHDRFYATECKKIDNNTYEVDIEMLNLTGSENLLGMIKSAIEQTKGEQNGKILNVLNRGEGPYGAQETSNFKNISLEYKWIEKSKSAEIVQTLFTKNIGEWGEEIIKSDEMIVYSNESGKIDLNKKAYTSLDLVGKNAKGKLKLTIKYNG